MSRHERNLLRGVLRGEECEWVSSLPMGLTLFDLENEFILETLRRFDGNRTHAASSLGMSLRALSKRILLFEKSGIKVEKAKFGGKRMPRANIPNKDRSNILGPKDVKSLDYVTLNFKRSELSCPCCGKFNMDEPMLSFIQEIRTRSGVVMPINSGVRCGVHNEAVKGARDSAHLYGLAIDVKIFNDTSRYKLIQAAVEAKAAGIGIYSNFLHIDRKIRASGPVIWVGR